MKKVLLILAVAAMSFAAVSCGGKKAGSGSAESTESAAAEAKPVTVSLNSAGLAGVCDFFTATCIGNDLVVTQLEKNGDNVVVELQVPIKIKEPGAMKSVTMNAKLTYRDAQDKSVDLTPVPFDANENAELAKFIAEGKKDDVKAFKFKGEIPAKDVEAFLAAKKHFLNLVDVNVTK